MALCKPSSFAENSLNVRQSTRQEEKILRKRLALMNTMHHQMEVNLGLDRKMITRRLKTNLERSVQTQSKINNIKKSMPEFSSKHYKDQRYGSAQALMEIWGYDENAGKSSNFTNDVTIPAAIDLLNASGFAVEKRVSHKLENLRKVHSQHQKTRNSNRRARSTSLSHLARREEEQPICLSSKIAVANKNQSSGLETGTHSRQERCGSISKSSNSSLESMKQKRRRVRADTQPDIATTTSKHADILTWVTESERPLSASNQKAHFSTKHENKSVIESPLSKKHAEAEKSSELPVDIVDTKPTDTTSKIDNSDDLRVYCESEESECPMKQLHKKVHFCPETITLIDLHRASVVAKNYPTRMRSFVRETQKWKIPENDKIDGLTGDYYSFRIQRNDRASTTGAGRRVSSARTRSKSATLDNSNAILDEEHEYYERARHAMTDWRQKSMTIKSLSATCGPSEYIEST